MTYNYKKDMHRIIVIGPPGSGKSTFARKLHSLLALPLHHLDNIWWKPDGSHISREEFDDKLNELLKEENWIIEGNYSRTFETRIKAADTVIFLDYDPKICIEGIIERVGKKRSDIPWVEQEADEELIKFVNEYEKNNKPVLEILFQKYSDKRIIIFHERSEAEKWLSSLGGN